MFTRLLAVAALLLLATFATADDKADKEARVKKITDQIADTEKKLASLKKDLLREDEATKFVKAAEPLYTKGAVEIGTEGPLAAYVHMVHKVVDEDTMVLVTNEIGSSPYVTVRGVNTKGFLHGQKLTSDGVWQVVSREKGTHTTTFVIRPGLGAKFAVVK